MNNTPGTIDLKSFAFQVEQMRMAQKRYFELAGKSKHVSHPDVWQAKKDVLEMSKQLEKVVDDTLIQINNQVNVKLGEYPYVPTVSTNSTTVRIAPDQVAADQEFLVKLEDSVEKWKAELEIIEKELIDQALIDVKQGQRSSRYQALEKREADLKNFIHDANVKLGRVTERVANPAFANQVQDVLKNVK